MAIPFTEPDPTLRFNGAAERRALNAHFTARGVPQSRDGRLLLASWNIANLGAQGRPPRSLALIAHVLSRFDLIAVQELNDDFRAFERLVRRMDGGFDFVMSDRGGNNERLAFVYRTGKIAIDRLWGEVALTKREYPRRNVTVHYRQNGRDRRQTFRNHRFVPFDRNPFVGSFRAGRVDFVAANVHLYFGAFQNSTRETERRKYARRVLEIHALARWANRVNRGGNAWDRDIILLGDMNIPNTERNEATIRALREFGWQSLDYVSDESIGTHAASLSHVGGTNLGNDKTYDQIAFAPESLGNRVRRHGVFDFDNAVFQRKWSQLGRSMTPRAATRLFSRYVKFHISDHRPLWVELRTT